VALYKGLKVAVYTVDKPEISLTRQDLVELVNVRSFSDNLLLIRCERENRTFIKLSPTTRLSTSVILKIRF